jgi:nuclear pore complex protein Nup98-Nup96
MEIDSDHTSDFGEDDTFYGKQLLTVPGGFGKRSAINDMDNSVVKSIEHDDPGSEQSEYSDNEMSGDDGMDMAGSYPVLPEVELPAPNKAPRAPGTPRRTLLDIDLQGDWAEQLQRTISPRKQNRDALREAQSKVQLDREYAPIKPGKTAQKEFRTSIDVLNALFDKRGGRTGTDDAGFEV